MASPERRTLSKKVARGPHMWWIIGGGLGVGLFAGASAIWLFGPTVRTFFQPDFEPASKDDLSVYRAQQSGDSHGAGQ
jgi:hypothetical protein